MKWQVIKGLILAVVFAQTAHAMSPVSEDMIRHAQYYGKSHAHVPEDEFLQPWTVYEKEAKRLQSSEEHAYVYTPFLLVAADARSRYLQGEALYIEQGKEVLQQYADTLVLKVIVHGHSASFVKNTKSAIRQEDKVIAPYECLLPTMAEAVEGAYINTKFKMEEYVYVKMKQLVVSKPIRVSVTTGDTQQHHFYISLSSII